MGRGASDVQKSSIRVVGDGQQEQREGRESYECETLNTCTTYSEWTDRVVIIGGYS